MKNLLNKISVAVFASVLAVAGINAGQASATGTTTTGGTSTTASCDTTNLSLSTGVDCGGTGEGQSQSLFGEGGIFTTIINVLLFLIGVVSVIMLIYGGIQYTLSSGDSGKVNNAKNTILYAIVGLIVAILSYAIVNFVLKSLTEK